MKNILILFFIFGGYCCTISWQSTILLDQNWQFKKTGDTDVWLPAKVPGCIHTDLLANHIIPDPFYANNEQLVQWVSDSDWTYKTDFKIDHKFLLNDFIDLHFEGLDTYADVYLNDSLILQANDMFLDWNIPVKKFLRKGDNELLIHFMSAEKLGKQFMQKYPVQLPADERVFTRKAQYQYGWDWGPKLITCGIWKNIELIATSTINLKQCAFTFHDTGSDTIPLNFYLEYNALTKNNYSIRISELTENKILFFQSHEENFPSTDNITIDFAVKQRWQPWQLGKQNKYIFKVEILKDKKILDSRTYSCGFSNIVLHSDADENGRNFYFTANNKKIFIKGCNMIPLSSFPSSVQKKDYLHILSEAKEMGINMIRVWGGGIYEDDYFYDCCDSLGIMVWQDFMFACAMYPNEPAWCNEYSSQVNRLKNHPCIALWCGNNENDEGWKNWGWQEQYQYSPEDSAYIAGTNSVLFDRLIPEQIYSSNKAQQKYISSSPLFGWGHNESLTQGDCHYWGVWWGKEPFEMYNQKVPRFMSEYGFQGMPSYRSFQQFIPANEINLNSASVKNHQKHPVGYETINEYMMRDYKIPEGFEDYIYVSQLLQAEGMQTAIEAHRRNMPYCMGTLFWQLNDCWPVTSWSIIDYYGNRKAAYYTVKKKYKPYMISVLKEGDNIKTYIVNDDTADFSGTIYYNLFTTDGKLIDSNRLELNLSAQTSDLYSTINIPWFLKKNLPEKCVLYISLNKGDSVLAETFFNFSQPKDMMLPYPEFSTEYDPVSNSITITSNVFAKSVYLYTDNAELKLSDNFFDLLPGKSKQISLQEIYPGLPENLKIKCLNTIYNE